jgi:hypothetical protein
MEGLVAGLLRYGTWIASIAIGCGLAFALFDPGLGKQIATVGIGLFILLPSLRVLLMLGVFVRERDYRFAAIAALVLTIILVGILLGLQARTSRDTLRQAGLFVGTRPNPSIAACPLLRGERGYRPMYSAKDAAIAACPLV